MTGVTTDRDLLDRFLADRDEASFAELVRRHGPGVWGACRRRLANPHDAEDAFQAAFLVLVRRAGRLRAGTPLGPWLGKVAALTARNVARANRRRAAVSGPMEHDIAATTAAELSVDLDAALLGLPEPDRAAVVLCHLDGLTRKEAAERLGCPEGTLSSRLSRALAKLRVRLADEVPPGLARKTVRVAVVFAVSSGSAGVSPAVARLTEGVIHMLWVKKLTAAGLVLAAAGMIGVGVVSTAGAGGDDPQPKAAAKADKPSAADKVVELVRQLDEAERAVIGAQMRMVLIQQRLRDAREAAGETKKPAADPVAELQRQIDAEAKLLAEDPVRATEREKKLAALYEALSLEKSRAAGLPKADLLLLITGAENPEGRTRYQIEELTGGISVHYYVGNPNPLPRLFARARVDPNGPKVVHVEARPGDARQLEVIWLALRAVRQAEFKSVTYSGPLPHEWVRDATAAETGVYWKKGGVEYYSGPTDLSGLPKDPPAAKK